MKSKPRHRHEPSLWIICGGLAQWCYQCGAWRVVGERWQKPSGIGGENPAMKSRFNSIKK